MTASICLANPHPQVLAMLGLDKDKENHAMGRQNWAKLIDEANAKALQILTTAQPVLVDVVRAGDIVPGLTKHQIFHAGPPITWDRMCGPMRGAVTGAILFEKWAKDLAGAEKLAASGKIEFSPCHHHQAVGPMAGVLSPSQWVFVVKNQTQGNVAFCSLNEGLGKVLRFGANSPEVIERLGWMGKVLGPALHQALTKAPEGINIKNITAQALQMGDECHNRNVAATTMLLREFSLLLLQTDLKKPVIREILAFMASNPHFFLNVSMAACKATTDPIVGIKYCSVLSTMARNGTDIGIRVAGLGEQWFTAPAGMPKGLFFSPYTQDDANPDMGDSTVSEVAGIGGYAMATAPAIVKFVGGTPADAVKYTRQMGEICVGRHRDYQMPGLNFENVPVATDIRKVVETGIAPIINTGIAHKKAGIGQVGAGILYAPMDCFTDALRAFEQSLPAASSRHD